MNTFYISPWIDININPDNKNTQLAAYVKSFTNNLVLSSSISMALTPFYAIYYSNDINAYFNLSKNLVDRDIKNIKIKLNNAMSKNLIGNSIIKLVFMEDMEKFNSLLLLK